jgi:hypothetical protein
MKGIVLTLFDSIAFVPRKMMPIITETSKKNNRICGAIFDAVFQIIYME